MNKKISELSEANELQDQDVFMTVQNGENKKVPFNKIYDKAIDVIVSATEPTTNRRKVWMQKGKNLIKSFRIGINYNENTDSFESDQHMAITSYIEIEPNVQYAFSHSLSTTAGGVCVFDRYFQFLEVVNGDTVTTPFTITNPNAKYIIVKAWHANISNESWMQLEQNNTSTAYESYVEPAIYVLNENGIYEEFEDNKTSWRSASGQSVCQYRKIGNQVFLRGLVVNNGSTDRECVQLETEFFNSNKSFLFVSITDSNTVVPIPITAAGIIKAPSGLSSGNYFTLDGISFFID